MLVDVELLSDMLTITLARPEKRNALSDAMGSELETALAEHRDNSEIKLMVLTGRGHQAFASGGDLTEFAAIRTAEAALAMSRRFRSTLDAIRSFPVPTVAALNGDAFGGGAELAMACDMCISAHHARIGFLQGKLNISTAWGGGIDLFARVGRARALRLLAGVEILNSSRARELGLIDEVAPDGVTFEEFVAAFCAPLQRRTALVMRAFKDLSRAQSLGRSSKELADIETARFAETWIHPDHWYAVDQNLGRAGQA